LGDFGTELGQIPYRSGEGLGGVGVELGQVLEKVAGEGLGGFGAELDQIQ
jgi:hypothetical protein